MRARGGGGGKGGSSNPSKTPSVAHFVLRQRTREWRGRRRRQEMGRRVRRAPSALCLRNTAAPHVLGQCQGRTPRLPQGGERCVCVRESVCFEPVETGGLLFYPALCPIRHHWVPQKQSVIKYNQLCAQDYSLLNFFKPYSWGSWEMCWKKAENNKNFKLITQTRGAMRLKHKYQPVKL